MGIKHRQDSVKELRRVREEKEQQAADEQKTRAITTKLAVMSLGVEVELTPEDTERVAIVAELPPIADGVKWRAGLNLAEGTIIEHESKNYQVLQGHISQAEWSPPVVPALFKAIASDYAEWTQPQGAHDAYMKGDKVSYNGKKYESAIDYNVYSPEAYPAGWKEVQW